MNKEGGWQVIGDKEQERIVLIYSSEVPRRSFAESLREYGGNM